jgi:hypothetical protein
MVPRIRALRQIDTQEGVRRDMDVFILVSLAAEVVVMILGLMLAAIKKKDYGCGIALTFGIYVFYDSVRFFNIPVTSNIIGSLFFIASLSILWAVWRIYEQANSQTLHDK